MTSEFIRCEFCKTQITCEPCEFAVHRTTVEGKEYVFCCEQCAKRFEQERKKAKKK